VARIIESKLVLSGDARGAEAAVDAVAKKLAALGKSTKAAESVDKMARALQAVKAQMDAIDRFSASRKGFDGAQAKLAFARAEAVRVAAAMKSINAPNQAAAAAEMKRVQAAVAQATRAYEMQKTAVLGNRRALSEMGIDVSQAAAHQAKLRAELARTTAMIDKQAKSAGHVGHQWSRHGAMGAAAGVAAGYVSAHGIGHGIKETVMAGAKYAHEVTGLENAGRTPAEMAEIEAASKRASKNVPTSTYTENLKVLNETTGAFGSLHHAIENLEFVQKAASVIHAAAGDKVHEGPGEMGNKMARFFEMRGSAGDSHLFQQEASQMVRAMQFTRGNFNPTEMLNFAQQAKGALQNYSMDFLGSIVPSLVTEMGGDRSGTGANAWRNTLMGKVRDKKQTAEWVRLGLLDPKQVDGGRGGSPQSWRAGAVKDTDLALQNPLAWTEKVLIPALQANGTNVDDPLDLSKALGTMFRNQNANQFAEQITQLRARSRLHKDKDLMAQVKGLDESYAANLKTDPTVAITGLTAAIDNLMTSASSPAMKSAAQGINWIAEALQSAALWGKEHPAMAMGGGIAAGGGALAGAGFLSYKLMTGFGLSTSAIALDASAAALTAAAARLGGGPAIDAAKNAAGGSGIWSKLGIAGVVGSVVAGGYEASKFASSVFAASPELRKAYDNPMLGAMDPDGAFAAAIMNAGGGRELTGSADVKGEVEVKVTVEDSRVSVSSGAAKLSGEMNLNGAGSVGKSSPDALPGFGPYP
jgi:hypothetical protein